MKINELKCWPGYERVPGTKAGAVGSCRKKSSKNEDAANPADRGLTIFDIDDTLMHTTAKIRVVKDGKTVRELTNQEFNNYKLAPGEQFDFGEFRSAEKFAKESEPIRPMIAKLKAIMKNAGNSKVIMLTARADFDDRDTFLDTFRKYGVDIDNIHVHRAGNISGPETPALKKAVWVRRYLDTGMYNRVRLYDDSMSNLRAFKDLKDEYPAVDFKAYYVGPSGSSTVVEVDLKGKLATGAVAGALAVGQGGALVNKLTDPDSPRYQVPKDAATYQMKEPPRELPKSLPAAQPKQQTAPQVQAEPKAVNLTGSPYETLMHKVAQASGIQGTELAAFMAQMAHESMDFTRMYEKGIKRYFNRYDPRYSPGTAKILGNTRAGDGYKYRGRGFIQLTGRDNYTRAGKALGIDLANKPDLAADPKIAAQIAVWFWKNRVQPKVDDFSNVNDVTRSINPNMRGLKDRAENFKQYQVAMADTGADS